MKITIVFLLMALSVSSASVGGTAAERARKPFVLPAPFDWKKEPWSADDTAFSDIRAEVNRLVKSGHRPADLAKKYGIIAKAHPTDAKAWFRWAHAARRAALAGYPPNPGEVVDPINAAQNWVLRAHSYEVTRLHYLLVYLTQRERGTLIPVGARLLEHNPHDVDVEQSMIDLLSYAPTLAERKKAVAYANALLNSNPKKPGYYSIVGAAYMGLATKSHKKEDRDKALLNYQTYLNTASADAPFRKDAKHWMERIRAMH